MRIGCLQFAPQAGDVDNNLNRADAILSRADFELDLLVLPEMAFTGCNFATRQAISPFLEPSGAGITALWARTMAIKHNCTVMAGYPEKADMASMLPTSPGYCNSIIMVRPDGETIANYSDEPKSDRHSRFYDGIIPRLGQASVGKCTDLGKSEFENVNVTQEFAYHILEVRSNLAIISMVWEMVEDLRRFSSMPNEPDMDSLTCWVMRLEPLIRVETDEEIIVVFCNRTGSEGNITYAGTSAVVGIKGGEVSVYGLLGRGEKELLFVDTEDQPIAKLVCRPENVSSGEVDEMTSEEVSRSPSRSPREPITPETLSQGGGPVHILSEKNELRGYHTETEPPLEKTAPLRRYETPQQAPLPRRAVRPTVVIPPSTSSRPEEVFLNNPPATASTPSKPRNQSAFSDESATSAGTVRKWETSRPHSDNKTPVMEHWSRQKMQDRVVPQLQPEDFTPTTPFQDLTPMSAAWSWPESLSGQKEQRHGDWNPGTAVGTESRFPPKNNTKEASRPSDSNFPRSRGLSMRPDTPAVAAGRPFLWPRTPQPVVRRTTGTALSRVADVTERPDSPKSRNVSAPILRHKSGSVMRFGDFSAAEQHLQGVAKRASSASLSSRITENNTPPNKEETLLRGKESNQTDILGIRSAVDEPESGAIRVSASSSILEEHWAKNMTTAASAPTTHSRSSALSSRRSTSKMSFSSRCSEGSSRTSNATGVEKVSPTESRGRRKEREPWPQVAVRSTSQDSTRNDILHQKVRRPSCDSDRPLRKARSQQAVREGGSNGELKQTALLRPRSAGGQRLISVRDFNKKNSGERVVRFQKRPRFSSQGVLPTYISGDSQRIGITSWPVSKEELQRMTAEIQERLIASG